MSLLIIALLGLALARLHALGRQGGLGGPVISVPDDVWAALEASMSESERAALPRPVPPPAPRGLNTVGGMAVGDQGHVGARAAAVDVEGRLWLVVTAVVHPTPGPGRVAVRRTGAGYHLQRNSVPVGLWDGGPAERSARVRVEGRFD